MAESHGRRPNRLIDEKSPYLQQHAYNPVEWYPWGEEAFERARREDKPIFLSIGYSTCHWCHVMERESFEDEETARMMNEMFVSIKVDREERPDVDGVYMTAVQSLTGSGGWPLSAWLTPELKPFYAGTYFPPRPAYGRPSFRNVLTALHDAWVGQRDKVERSAAAILDAIVEQSVVAGGGEAANLRETIDRCYEQLERSYDPRYGGFGSAPKFPRPVTLEFLLRYYREYGTERALDMVSHTMRRMASGGMYDQLGGGFARYSVDAFWRVPHFEKMLYDQGQILSVCADLVRLTNDRELMRLVRQTVDYLVRDLTAPNGLFYSAEDADSEGEEGTFYVWRLDELRRALDDAEFRAVERYYEISEEGNFEHGKNVLHIGADIETVANEIGESPERTAALLESARVKLFVLRSNRPRPHRDEKILTSWNALMISGLARVSAALDEPEFARIAIRAADTLVSTMNVDGVLMHRLKDGEVKFDGYLEDYAFLAAALIDLYETTFEIRYLKEADRLVRRANDRFWDEDGGGYFMTTGDDPTVLIRSKGDYDGAEPAGNSVMALNLLRLGRIFDDRDFLERADRTVGMFASRLEKVPVAMPLMIAAAVTASHPPRQIVIAASDDAEETARLIRQVHDACIPGTALLLVGPDGPDEWLAERIDTLNGMRGIDGHAAVYVCENFVCRAPTREFAG